jgi:hypothetical protein
MGQEHAPETVWKAQELYCSDRLSFTRVAEQTGVADSTVRRWADIYGWREKREAIAQAEAEIRADKVLARSKTVKALLDNPRADTAFAVSALENLALKEAEAARQGALTAQPDLPPVSIRTTGDAIPHLRRAVEQKLALLLSRPESVDLKPIQEIHKCLTLITQLEAAQPKADEADSGNSGISADLAARIEAAMRGE